MKKFICASAIVAVLASPVSAASIKTADGNVFVSKGSGYVPASAGTTLLPGDRVMVSNNSKAVVAFDDGCQYELLAGKLLAVHKASPCADPSRVTDRKADLPGRMSQSGAEVAAISPLVVGGVVVGGAIVGAVVVSNANKKKSP